MIARRRPRRWWIAAAIAVAVAVHAALVLVLAAGVRPPAAPPCDASLRLADVATIAPQDLASAPRAAPVPRTRRDPATQPRHQAQPHHDAVAPTAPPSIPPPPLPRTSLASAALPTTAARMPSLPPLRPDVDALATIGALASAAAGGLDAGAVAGLEVRDDLDRPVRVRVLREPRYPPRALALGLQDAVTVRFVVGVDGRARDLAVERSAHPELFVEPVLAALRAARFDPGQRDGRAVPARTRWTVRFEVPPSSADRPAAAPAEQGR